MELYWRVLSATCRQFMKCNQDKSQRRVMVQAPCAFHQGKSEHTQEGGLAPGEGVVASATGVQGSDCGPWALPGPCWCCRAGASSQGCITASAELPWHSPLLFCAQELLSGWGWTNSTGTQSKFTDKKVWQRKHSLLPWPCCRKGLRNVGRRRNMVTWHWEPRVSAVLEC